MSSYAQETPSLLRFGLTRRQALLGLGAAFTLGGASVAFALGGAPVAFANAPAGPLSGRRFVVVLMRGALDGLSAVQPYGDPACADIRQQLALPPPGQPGGLLDLGGMYGLHPSLAQLHAMYAANQMLILHAVAGHYRSRSHFEAQDYLESGTDQRLNTGWLNRAVGALPAPAGADLALSVALSPPLLLRGPNRVQAWAPEHQAQPDPELYARLVSLAAGDKVIGPALAEAVKARGIDAQVLGNEGPGPQPAVRANGFATLAGAAGRLMAQANGPRVTALEIGGWDTHAGQVGRLKAQLAQFDAGMAALKEGLGEAWTSTAVIALTEFGRTARINGTNGTDHGTAGVAFLAGGAVAGGRVLADWPGLAAGKLFENRDLAPTTDARGILKGLLVHHLGIAEARLAPIFPGSADASPATGLLNT